MDDYLEKLAAGHGNFSFHLALCEPLFSVDPSHIAFDEF